MGLTQTINFDTPGNFNYDASLIDLSSGAAKLKDLSPANATFFAGFEAGDFNGDYGGGVLTGTNSGGVLTTGGGGKFGEALNLTGGTLKYVYFPAALNADFTQVGAIGMWVKPNYTASPSSVRQFFSISKDHTGSLNNLMESYHDNTAGTGHIWWRLFDSAGGSIFSADLGAWSPVSGTWYYLEWNIDITTGASRFFINGTQFGATQATTGTRTNTAGFLNVGTDRSLATTTDFLFDDIVVFSAVQHTANFTAPTTSRQKYSTANPSIYLKSGQLMDGLLGFTETSTIAGTDAVKHETFVDSVGKWFNGAAWAAANDTYTQTNLATEVDTNKATLGISTGASVYWKSFLHSANGRTTPTLTRLSVNYNFFDPEVLPSTTILTAWAKDFLGNRQATNVTIIVTLKAPFWNGENLIETGVQSFSPDAQGYFEFSLVESSASGRKYNFAIQYKENGTTKVKKLGAAVVPNTGSAKLSTLLPL